MADAPRSLEEIDADLASKNLTPDEPRRVLREVIEHMIRQQKEIDELKKRGGLGDVGGTPIVRTPDGKVYL